MFNNIPMKKRKVSHKPKHTAIAWLGAVMMVMFTFTSIMPAMEAADASAQFQLAEKKKKAKEEKKKATKKSTKTKKAETKKKKVPVEVPQDPAVEELTAPSTPSIAPEASVVTPTSPTPAVGTGAYRFTPKGTYNEVDADGWINWTKENTTAFTATPGLTVFMTPAHIIEASGGATLTKFFVNDKNNIFGSGFSFTINTHPDEGINRDALNKSAAPANVERIDMVVSTDPEDTKLSTKEYANAYFNVIKSAIQNMPIKAGDSKLTCQWPSSDIATAPYGTNEVTTLTYLQKCMKSGWDGPKWSQPTYAFMKGKSSGSLLAIYVKNSNSFIMNAGNTETDPSRVVSKSFLSQFLEKLRFN